MSILKSKYDCFHDMPEVEPNGDISGPGVIAGFLGTAYLSIFVLTCYYLFVFDPKKNPYHQQPEPSGELTVDENNGDRANGGEINVDEQIKLDVLSGDQGDGSQQQPGLQPEVDAPPASAEQEADWIPNPIDVWFLENVRSFPNILHKAFPKLFSLRQPRHRDTEAEAKIERAFSDCMRSICNNQLVTGLGILVSAYWILHRADGQGLITAYHWQIAVYLAWLSNLTHTTGLTLLRRHLACHKMERLWRVLSMICLFILVFVSFQPLVYFNWEAEGQENEGQAANASSHAVCFFKLGVARERIKMNGFETAIPYSSGTSAILSMLLLVFSFATRMMKLSATSSRFSRVTVRKRASDKMKRILERWSPKSTHAQDKGQPVLTEKDNFIATVGMAAMLTLRLHLDLLTSMLAEVYWAFVAGAWASMRVFKSRSSAQVNEDMFSFGQILATFFLVSPFVTALVAMWSLRFALWMPQNPQSRGLLENEAEKGPAVRVTAAEAYRQFAESTTSYDIPRTSLIITGACLHTLMVTAIYFRQIGWFDAKVFITIVDAAFIAIAQPLFCFAAYIVAVGSAAKRARPLQASQFVAKGAYNIAAVMAGMGLIRWTAPSRPPTPEKTPTKLTFIKVPYKVQEKVLGIALFTAISAPAMCLLVRYGCQLIHAATGIMPPDGYYTLVLAAVYPALRYRWDEGLPPTDPLRIAFVSFLKGLVSRGQAAQDGATDAVEMADLDGSSSAYRPDGQEGLRRSLQDSAQDVSRDLESIAII